MPRAGAACGCRSSALLVSLSGQQPRAGVVVGRRGLWRSMSLIVCWLLAIAALMRPQWIEPPLHRDKPARDLLLLVDLSGSMDTRTSPTPPAPRSTGLTAVKQVLDEFLARRKGDRVGVVVFGNAPFTLVPFTTDLDLCRRLVRRDCRSAWPARAPPSAMRSASASISSPVAPCRPAPSSR